MTTTMMTGDDAADWGPMEAIVSRDGLGEWMWMYATVAPATGRTVHVYKHVSSRCLIRLDADGRVYGELEDGAPVVLPACGGVTLLVTLLRAYATGMPCLPAAIAIPAAVREDHDEGGFVRDELALSLDECQAVFAAYVDDLAAGSA